MAAVEEENALLKQEDNFKKIEIERLVVELAKRPAYAKGEPKQRVRRERQDAIAKTVANYLRAIMGVAPYADVPNYANGDLLTFIGMLEQIQKFADRRGTLSPSKPHQIGKALLDIGISGHANWNFTPRALYSNRNWRDRAHGRHAQQEQRRWAPPHASQFRY